MKSINVKNLFNAQTIKGGLKTAVKFAEKQAPVLTAGVAIAAMIAGVFAAAKAGPKVQEALETAHIKKNEKALAERMDQENFSDETPIVDLTFKEKVPIYAKGYLKTFLLVLLSGTCMVGSVYFSNKQKAALSVLLAAAESRLVDMESATKAVVGDKNFEKIKGAIVDQGVEKDPPMPGNIVDTGCGKTLCLEPIFKTYYWSDISEVKKAYAEFFDMYVHTQTVYMEDLYNLLHIPATYVPDIAGDLGFMYDLEEGIELKPEYNPRSVTTTLNGVEYCCYVMDLKHPKTYDQLLGEAETKRRFWK